MIAAQQFHFSVRSSGSNLQITGGGNVTIGKQIIKLVTGCV